MIDLVLKFILLILVLFLIVLPVCVNIFKEQGVEIENYD